ncbi:FAS1-like dehydratase domain-containing protein [Schinkia sp. CFF1]
MLDHTLIGQKTKSVTITITNKMVGDYVNMIGDNHPIFLDSEEARKNGYPDVVIPATYPVLFWKYITIPWLENVGPLIHGKQSFRYQTPLSTNQPYSCFIELADIYEKGSAKGKLQFLIHRLVISAGGRDVAEAVSVLILLEKKVG